MNGACSITLSNAHYARFPFTRFLQHQRSLHRTQISLYSAVPHVLLDHQNIEEAAHVKAALEEYGLRAETMIPSNYGYSLFADPGTEHYAISLAYYQNCVRAAKQIGVRVLCLRPQHGRMDRDRQAHLDGCIAMLKEILVTAEAYSMPIALGTAAPKDAAALHTLPKLCSVLREVEHPMLGALLDTHIMSQAGETVEQWMTALGDRVYHVFLSDGRTSGYCVWGKGIYPISNYWDTLLRFGYQHGTTCFVPDFSDNDNPEAVDRIHHNKILCSEGVSSCTN